MSETNNKQKKIKFEALMYIICGCILSMGAIHMDHQMDSSSGGNRSRIWSQHSDGNFRILLWYDDRTCGCWATVGYDW